MMPREQCQLKMKMKTAMTAKATAAALTRVGSRQHAPASSLAGSVNRRSRVSLLSLQLLALILITRVDLLGCLADDISEADRPIPIVTVEGVLGNQGKLPCDIRVPTRDDKVHMVLWFRDNGDPIYRFDVRDKPSTDAKRWSDMGERVYFQAMSEPAHLLISDLKQHDGGVYRCRVDFKNSPTRNSRINLTIIVPPMKPVIYDANGIASTVIGPYNEGSELLLTCEVVGGFPKSKVSWWLENEMIDGHWVDRTDGVLVNHLNYKPLQRHHLNAQFVCQASNTNKTVPQSSMVVLNLNLRPLTVSITTKDANLLAEKRYDIECISTGSRPPATISWWKNSRQIKKTPHNPSTDDKNVTRSILNLIPTVDDDGKILTCRSENLWIPNSAMEDRWRLNVHYAPRVTMQLGSNLVADDIKEGDDVYFECSVKSNPPYKKLTWFHEGRELRHNASQRVIMSNTRLVLQKITRHSAGRYTCNALNNEGLSQSNVVHLRVKFVPTCKSKSEELIGAMRHETVTIRCEMLSDPPSVQFHWTFNNSGIEVTPISHSRFSSNGTVSLFNYTPASEMDFGTLTCWGGNLIGHGTKEPCHFQIVQAGRPFPPRNCSIYNQTEDSLGILCLEGFNGGLPQHFVIEVVDTQTKKIIRSSSSKMPLFKMEGMEPSIPFKFTIFAVNAKGKSENVIIDGITFRGVAKYTGSTTTAEMNPVYAILVGCSVVLIIFLIVTIIAIWKRSRRKKPPIAKSHLQHNHNRADTSSNNSDEAFQSTEATLTKIDQNNVGSLEDVGNPDVIPNKNGGGGLRGFIRIHKTPPAKRRKKEVEVKNNGETVPLTETQEVQLHQNHNHTNHGSGSNKVAAGGRFGGVLVLPTNSNSSSNLPRESRI